jgi:hypothetical protein
MLHVKGLSMSTELVTEKEDALGADRGDFRKLMSVLGRAAATFAEASGESLSPEEAALWAIVARSLPPSREARYRILCGKVHDESLPETEYEELRELTNDVEMLHAERVEAVLKLAALRGVAPNDLAASIGMEE